MQRLEVSGAVRPIYWSLGVKRLRMRGGIRALCVPILLYNIVRKICFHLYVTFPYLHTTHILEGSFLHTKISEQDEAFVESALIQTSGVSRT